MRTNALLATFSLAAAFVVLSGQPASAQTQNQQKNVSKKTVVQRGDSLSKIAKANATTYVRIYKANTQVKHPDVIYPGQKLRIPAANEKLPNRPLPGDQPAAKPQPAKPVKKAAPVQKKRSSTPIKKRTVRQPAKQQRQSAPAPATATTVSGGVWDRLAACESGGNWQINTGNGYYGGLQFSLSSWRAVGGSGYPHQASKGEQIQRAEMLKARQGWGAWPACSAKLGLR